MVCCSRGWPRAAAFVRSRPQSRRTYGDNGEYEALVEIATGESVRGELPRTARHLVEQWRATHGREISYALYGDPDGEPLVALHGSADSRLIWRLLDSSARNAGVRLICLDRPGFGNSPFTPGRTTVDHADDVIALAEDLGLGEFATISISGGLVFGLTLAWSYPDRVRRFTSYSGLFITAPGALPEMNVIQRAIARLGLRFPSVLTPLGWVLFGPQVLLAARAPKLVFKMLRATRPPGDQAVLDRPEVKALMIDGVGAQFRSTPAVIAAMGSQQLPPFPFTLSEIRQPMATFDFDVHYPEMIATAVAMD